MKAHCSICDEDYYLGPPSGKLFIYYPQGEARYWEHTRTSKRHQLVCAATYWKQNEMLDRVPELIKAGQKARAKAKRQQEKAARGRDDGS